MLTHFMDLVELLGGLLGRIAGLMLTVSAVNYAFNQQLILALLCMIAGGIWLKL